MDGKSKYILLKESAERERTRQAREELKEHTKTIFAAENPEGDIL